MVSGRRPGDRSRRVAGEGMVESRLIVPEAAKRMNFILGWLQQVWLSDPPSYGEEVAAAGI